MRRTTVILSSIGGLLILLIAGWFMYQRWSTYSEAPATTTPSQQPTTTTTPTVTPESPRKMTFVSPKGVTITLDNWTTNKMLTSPATITGTVPGNWSFEASFPVEVLDASNGSLVKTPAHLTGDWMTTQQVPFTVTLTFTAPSSGTGVVRLHKDNPSGMATNDDTVDVPVRFGAAQ
jgi:hypothetical protein